MRRMLDPTKVGGIPSTIEFDKDGNRKVKKDLGVDGKLKLKSLVSATNPDGDITKELGGGGGGDLYLHCVIIQKVVPDKTILVNFYAKSNEKVNTIDLLNKYLLDANNVVCSGYISVGDHYAIAYRLDKIETSLYAYYIDFTNGDKGRFYLGNADIIDDTPIPVK